jgi:putative endonuclease
MAQHNELGNQGEERAATYLLDQGYRILERNWRSGHKDLDIIAMDGASMVIVEVKTRKSRRFGNPEDAVSERKIRNIVACADAYLRLKSVPLGTPVRFDIISVVEHSGTYELQHIKEAFYPPIWN